MASAWKKPLGAALLVEAVGLAGFFASALISFSADRVLPSFAFRWERTEALLDFLRWLPALQFLGLAIALGSSEGSDDEIASRAIVPAALLAIAFSALTLIAGPLLADARSSMLESSALFRSSLDAAGKALASGDLPRARSELGLCEAIAGTDPRVEQLEERLLNAELKAGKAASPAPAEEPPGKADAKNARDYYLKALEFSDSGDHFSAHWYAQTAARLDPTYSDAKRLAAKSWEALLARGGSAAEDENAAFYARKLEAYGLMRAGDPVAAYAIWRELAAKRGSDPDVKRYLAESLAEAGKVAFFKDEYDGAAKGEVFGEVFLRLPSKEGPARILAAAGASFAGEAAYFRELEYLEASGGGAAPRALVRAPFAKLSGGRLLLLCAGREPGSATYRPRWDAGAAPAPANVLETGLQVEVAYRVLAARERPGSLGVVSAWKAASEAPAYGADPTDALRDLVTRTGAPFALFASGLLGALAGARFRRRGGRFPRGLYALAPLMAAAGLPAYLLAERVDALLSSWAAAAARGFAAVWIAAGARTLLIALALLVVAGSRGERGSEEEA